MIKNHNDSANSIADHRNSGKAPEKEIVHCAGLNRDNQHTVKAIKYAVSEKSITMVKDQITGNACVFEVITLPEAPLWQECLEMRLK